VKSERKRLAISGSPDEKHGSKCFDTMPFPSLNFNIEKEKTGSGEFLRV
jgi:hypothetical protein